MIMMSNKENEEKELSQEEIFEKYRLAGKIAAEILNKVKEETKPGKKVLDLCLLADKLIEESEAEPAFPINISINNQAAHYTAFIDDESVIPENSVVKLDLGVHVDGFIADHAVTISFNKEYDKMVKVSEDAVKMVIDLMRPNTGTKNVGALIEEFVKEKGYKVVRNLTGHSLSRYDLHSEKILQTTGTGKDYKIEENDVFAVEIFVTDGTGEVHADVTKISIYKVLPLRVKLRLPESRRIRTIGLKKYHGLPMAERWLVGELKIGEIRMGYRELERSGVLETYPVLVEEPGAMVAQAEHTVIVHNKEAEITTKTSE